MLAGAYQVTGVGPTLFARNGEGDRYHTDGEVTIGVIGEGAAESVAPPATRENPPVIDLKNRAWRWMRSWFD